ncbi:GDSL esterase/lipase [Acorus calamus]|uniref:GDSL esterase/lipase n=1 Tax=Acorus calamus TaxID=4465 RepID=A0AAV9D6U2_ACOCL|nr:GDSL esterase/lipase [Acorus calamus]
MDAGYETEEAVTSGGRWDLVLASGAAAEANVPAIFIFGDSTADVGNNDYLPTRARANFPYYGIDFPNGTATGRFSNGFNSADEIARKFGFKMSPPPFLVLKLEELRAQMSRGINFASGAAGIFDHTGSSFGTVLPMGLQVQHFATVSANLTASMGFRCGASLAL